MKRFFATALFALSALCTCTACEPDDAGKHDAGRPGTETPGTPETPETPENNQQNDMIFKITVGGHTFTAEAAATKAAAAFAARMPLTLDMSELNGNEKYCYIDSSLPTAASQPGTINAGDVMLYGSSCIVIFYETFRSSYSYTPIGRITDTAGLKNALGTDSATVTFETAK